jgi:hypothetical protein
MTAFSNLLSTALVGAITLVAAPSAQAQININIGRPAYAPRVVVVEHAPKYKPYKPKKLKKGQAVYLVPTGPAYYEVRGKGHGKGKH